VPVAAICGAVLGLARADILNEKKHTGNSLAELHQAANYQGEALFQNQPAFTDGNLITARAIAPLEFAYQIFKKRLFAIPRGIGLNIHTPTNFLNIAKVRGTAARYP